ncbi:hypothetical protein C2869_14845 [Saccharobesus litoralis]|uniref:Toxin co-regulated pilus biosynthesis protein Q C-terminal domain-containing protein n=1 Tax=Saccharobesus litoralis TaxID=2172099 RepID=A0A2S0VTT7_9ALTE|nr:TcpQ domain-containing protein [Saccharobesus litoralis]AWB67634.1 hypothetical protein C2869_14845 [Saccharobesus litoralis]
MLFWLKHIFIIVVVIAAGVTIISLQQYSSEQTEASSKSPAKGLSDFYGEMKANFERNPVQREIFVVELNNAKTIDIDKQLAALSKVTRPVEGKWSGRVKQYEFTRGTTLKTELSKIAEKELVNLVWWLDRDYVVKHPFKVTSNAIGTLYQVTKAIDADFVSQVHGYFCPQQRALVISDKMTDYLRSDCIKASRNG